MTQLLYLVLAIFCLSFLIFIHELGHYFMARRVGMKVDTFSIGFGKPIWKKVIDGTSWQIGWILFGGYVKIAGMENSDEESIYEVDGGFFQKSPWDRIKVAFMGPLVNIVFAFFIFTLLWSIGGREKKFSEFTHKVGWVDPKSELFAKGVRPGDEITEYNDSPYKSLKDHIYLLLGKDQAVVKGFHVNYQTGLKTPFEYDIKTYTHPSAIDSNIKTVGVMHPAGYITYNRLPDGSENPLPNGSPLKETGIQYGDRIIWVDGQIIYSEMQLSRLLNDNRTLMTIERGDKTILRRVPRVKVKELRPNAEFKEELIDWKYEAGIHETDLQNLYAIPYNLTYDGVVETRLRFVDEDAEARVFLQNPFSDLEKPLAAGDKIVAVDGIPVSHAYEILRDIQSKYVNIIMMRDPKALDVKTVEEVSKEFNRNIPWGDLAKLSQSIGSENPLTTIGNLFLFRSVKPVRTKDLPKTLEQQIALEKRKREIEEIEDPVRRDQSMKVIENYENTYVLGLPNVQDRKVKYNPSPFEMFSNVLVEIWRTLQALFTGILSPKWMSGPVGIVQMVQTQSMVSLKEALFWIGAISLNLGALNLLPFPVLDGGTIVVSFLELLTGKRVNQKIYEKVVFLFVILLISFFVYVTFNDITRIFTGF